ncbi:MAG: hypothetical protein ACRCYY_20760 [Trueperaceae bacterium]
MKGQLHENILKGLAEVGQEDLPGIANVGFGHTAPTMVLPNGCNVAVDPLKKEIESLEPAVM